MPRRPRPKLPPVTLVLLVRHGTTATTGKVLPGRAPGLHLADTGRTQAEAVSERIGALPKVAAVYASPLDLFQRIVVSPCSVTAIAYGDLGPVVLAVNSTGALTELKPS